MQRGLRLKAVWALASTMLCLLLLEYVALPMYVQHQFGLPRGLAQLGFTARPNVLIDDTWTNSQGFTGPVLERRDRPPGSLRFLTLGGSAFFNRRMSERIMQRLDAATPLDVEVCGGALRTHSSISSLLKYERFFSGFDFDCVLIYHGINDLAANHVAPEDFRSDYSHLGAWYRRGFLLDHSILARRLYNRWWKRPASSATIWTEGPRTENGADFASSETFERTLVRLIESIRARGGVPVLMTFAWYIPDDYSLEAFKLGKLDYNNPTSYDRCAVELWGSREFVSEGLRRHNLVVRDIAEQHNVLLIDQELLLKDRSDCFGDVCHLSETGTDAFIENIAEFMLRHSLLEE